MITLITVVAIGIFSIVIIYIKKCLDVELKKIQEYKDNKILK
ncbi:MAG TPA: hypothetical protein VJH05_01185 [Candidatus Paceibacterota bacterium]